ncbi:MAG: acetyl-CoA carboxylase biotin carboxyl carrier protein subunit [Sphingomonadales bacterium]|nr:acetyl-CoA carboxylase biotin carboxyl carrier protein subunit [Sphingomonadales bacterium]
MKAIIQGQETVLEQIDGVWTPENNPEATVSVLPDGRLLLHAGSSVFTARLLELNRAEKTLTISLNGKTISVTLKEPLDDLLHSMGLDKMATAKVSHVKAPMPGLVLNVLVEAGQEVKKGDKLLVLEAMKMENIIKAAGDGKVGRIAVEKGQAVDKNQTLIEFE